MLVVMSSFYIDVLGIKCLSTESRNYFFPSKQSMPVKVQSAGSQDSFCRQLDKFPHHVFLSYGRMP